MYELHSAASYELVRVTGTFVVIHDRDEGRSVTNDAHRVVAELDEVLGGLGQRRLYYRDTTGRYDELKHEGGRFTGYAPCSDSQQNFLQEQASTPGI